MLTLRTAILVVPLALALTADSSVRAETEAAASDTVKAAGDLSANTSKPEPEPEPDVPEVPDSKKAAHSSESLARMKVILTKVLKYLSDARDEGDVVKLNCVNEKLTAIKGLLKISEHSDVTLQEALARRDPDISKHEFQKITISLRKCEQMLAESEACVGELAVYAGETEVVVEVVGVPDDKDDKKKDPNRVKVDLPASASPYQ